MFHQLVRPVSITVFLPAICLFQGNLYPFGHCRIKENVLIVSNTVLCQDIRIGNIFYLRIQIFFNQILCFCFGHVLSEVNSLLISIIFQSFLGSLLLVCIHISQCSIRIIRHLVCFQTIGHSPGNGSSICRESTYLKLRIIIFIRIACCVSIAVKHIKRIQVIQVICR